MSFKVNRVLVIGDIILDEYIFGKVTRISPEAPIPIVNVDKCQHKLGGAANVAKNLSSLGIKSSLIGIIGNDIYGDIIIRELNDNKIVYDNIIIDSKSHTTVKTRIIGGKQQICRYDQNDKQNLDGTKMEQIINKFSEIISDYDVVLISDYNKGVCSEQILKNLIRISNMNNKTIIVDPKGNNWEKYRGSTIIKPNVSEVNEILSIKVNDNDNSIGDNIKDLINQLDIDMMILTRSENGISLITKSSVKHFQSHAEDVFDVTGAGDTVVSVIAGFYNKMKLDELIDLSNKAASIVLKKIGTYSVKYTELFNVNTFSRKKVLKLDDDILSIVNKVKMENETIVFTNGVFDILHKGHLTLLKKAKELGSILILGINSDASVKRLKGDSRPINKLDDRIYLLENYNFIDYIIPFEDDTPYELIKKIKPNIIVKGGDYTENQVIGREFADKVVIVELVDNFSTTNIIKKIGGQNENNI